MTPAAMAQASPPETLVQGCAVHRMDEWPLLISQYHRRSTDAEFEAYLRFVINLLTRKERFVLLIDNHHPDTMGRERGERVARWNQANRAGLSLYVPGIAIVSADMSRIRRFAASSLMSVMGSMGGMQMQYSFHARLENGKAWARRLLARGR